MHVRLNRTRRCTGTSLSHVTPLGKMESLLSKQVSAIFAYTTPKNLEAFSCSARLRARNSAPAAHQRSHSLRQTVRARSLFVHPVSGGFPFLTRLHDGLLFPSLPRSCFIISHAHLDHVNGLVLSAGSLLGPRKRVCAPQSTLKTLETIFSDRIWPNLASWDADDAAYKLLYDPCV